jgi:diguanylate cyclase (GGDEF)-like protein
MDSGAGAKAEVIVGEAQGSGDSSLRRSFNEWARQLAGCRLCRNLTIAAFAAILAIEAAILVPSYRNYEEDLLRQQVNLATQAIATFLNAKTDQPVTSVMLKDLLANSPLTGVSMQTGSGTLAAGEEIGQPGLANAKLRDLPRTDDGAIDLAWQQNPHRAHYEVHGRVDVSAVRAELIAFVWRILGLSLLIAVFVTIVTMAMVDRMMLSPLLKLRERISRAGKDTEHPMQYVSAPDRCDEFGEVESAFNSMLKQNSSYLSRLNLLNQRLDQLLEERTRSLRKTEQELEIRTLYDQLTGLANRNLFEEQLDRHFAGKSANNAGSEALMVLGLNDFQTLNGTAGHETGDRLLQEVARRIAGYSGDQSHVARLGGDIFGVLVSEPDRAGTEGLESRISAIVESCEAPVRIGGKLYEFEVSAGVAVTPLDGEDARTLLSHAEIAMHRAKKTANQRVQFFAAEFGDQVHRRQEMIRDLKGAVRKDQLQLYYQPQFDQFRHCVGYEALLRWHHPVHGIVSPVEFIPLAEETGQILNIGDWVLEEAISRLAIWIEQGYTGRIGVNVSAVQLSDVNLSQRIDNLLMRFGVSPRHLELEITETALMNDVEQAMATLEGFRTLGLQLAVDDFGTGYSSLAYLKTLPVSRIKIDRAFVTGLPDNEQDVTLCRTMITMAHNLGCEVIAEGVETEAQARWLTASGCDELQGFLLGKPAIKGFS